ncbi:MULTISPECIES: DUF4399 domain-containing protein [unclassified Leisingera]|nr:MULTISPECIES: DUF4399 domain-containing protein [unclassified Leisingera]
MVRAALWRRTLLLVAGGAGHVPHATPDVSELITIIVA